MLTLVKVTTVFKNLQYE